MEKFVCIHGHFYQPPRENPWLEAIEYQESAHPFHDWNERITAECYAPNGASRILNPQGRIVRIVNNYSKMSFNFGPTLLSWMKEKSPEVYREVLEADKTSQKSFSGHGSAIAQAYNHMILPLASERDKHTQVLWGIKDFQSHFGRFPEGMWLPETAVDAATLEVLAEHGIRFTILAPHQARRVRKIGGTAWKDISGGRIDPSRAYLCKLPSGKKINLFFYDGPISRAVAFEGLLTSGEKFAKRLLEGFSDKRNWPQLVHLATDGESYGHHHRHGDMALSFAANVLESDQDVKITNYGEYLEKYPPAHQVEIVENSSWSCVHGIGRWWTDCGCNSGGRPGWNQSWRTPLRNALDWLRDSILPLFENRVAEYLKDSRTAWNDYISVILDRSDDSLVRFLNQHSRRQLTEAEKITTLKLLELQRQSMLMFTSCGWFFDELSGIETVQVIQYAGRAIQLAQDLFGQDFEPGFLERLETAQSNLPEHQNGKVIYQKFVQPAAVDLLKLCAHYAVSALFREYGEKERVYCYTVERKELERLEDGKAKVIVGQAQVTSHITRETDHFSFGAIYLGDHNLHAGVRSYPGDENHKMLLDEISDTFTRADFPEVIRILGKHFGDRIFSLKSLFKDEQRKILYQILENTLAQTEGLYREIYNQHAPLIRFIEDLKLPLPRAFSAAAEMVITSRLRDEFEHNDFNAEVVKAALDEAKVANVSLDRLQLGHGLENRLETMGAQLLQQPLNLILLNKLNHAIRLAGQVPLELDLWKLQNVYFKILQEVYPQVKEKAGAGDKEAEKWLESFITWGESLSINTA